MFGLAFKLDVEIDDNIEILKHKRHFNTVDWTLLKKSVGMNNVKDRLKNFKNLQFEEIEEEAKVDFAVDNMDHLKKLNLEIKKIEITDSEASEEEDMGPEKRPVIKKITNINMMQDSSKTFKGMRKKDMKHILGNK